MTNPDQSQSASGLPPPVLEHLPTTFLDRGIAVPFTTPQLAGARVRPADRQGLELIVPNPSGGRGVYILPWDDITSLCRPTVYDLRLSAMVNGAHGVTPATIRKAARTIAAQGYAGRTAAAAAKAADESDRQAGLIANFTLLLELVRCVEKPGENPVPPERERPVELERRARRAIARVAPDLGRTPESIAAALEQIGTLFGGIGLRAGQSGARLQELLARLVRLRQDAARFIETNPPEGMPEADLVAGSLDLTISCTRATLADAHALSADIVGMLKQWITAPEEMAHLIARADWLLDGWDRVAGLWEIADHPSETAAVLAEICNLVPVIPRELGSWVSQHINIDTDMNRHRRRVILLEDWRTGRNLSDMIARNETIIA